MRKFGWPSSVVAAFGGIAASRAGASLRRSCGSRGVQPAGRRYLPLGGHRSSRPPLPASLPERPLGDSYVQRALVFWDLDNLIPPSGVGLNACLASLEDRLISERYCHTVEGFRLYANGRTMKRAQTRPWMLPANATRRTEALVEDHSHGWDLWLREGASLTQVPTTPDAADKRLIQNLNSLVNSPRARLTPGTLCLVSGDEDYRGALASAMRLGWRVVIVCSQAPSHGLAHHYIGWSNICGRAAAADAVSPRELFFVNPGRKRDPN